MEVEDLTHVFNGFGSSEIAFPSSSLSHGDLAFRYLGVLFLDEVRKCIRFW